MYILGVNPGYSELSHDSSACLIKDGEIIAFVGQERFDRIKHSNAFPTDAINYCLRKAGITDNQVDHIAINMNPKEILKSIVANPFSSFNPHNA